MRHAYGHDGVARPGRRNAAYFLRTDEYCRHLSDIGSQRTRQTRHRRKVGTSDAQFATLVHLHEGGRERVHLGRGEHIVQCQPRLYCLCARHPVHAHEDAQRSGNGAARRDTLHVAFRIERRGHRNTAQHALQFVADRCEALAPDAHHLPPAQVHRLGADRVATGSLAVRPPAEGGCRGSPALTPVERDRDGHSARLYRPWRLAPHHCSPHKDSDRRSRLAEFAEQHVCASRLREVVAEHTYQRTLSERRYPGCAFLRGRRRFQVHERQRAVRLRAVLHILRFGQGEPSPPRHGYRHRPRYVRHRRHALHQPHSSKKGGG
mmetsp:Transcript_12160/g.30594  ORF Transcript_12160/g.30594 Transcript_12160/m.30594 type:complete len:320 (-) Transcript_12160:1160-2119(-)